MAGHLNKSREQQRILPRRTRGTNSRYGIRVSFASTVSDFFGWYRDPFYSLLRQPFWMLSSLFMCLQVLLWCAYAPVYLLISDKCNLNTPSYLTALHYSLITMSTIGYGTPDLRFGGCWEIIPAIMCQMLIAFVANSVMVGTMFVKISQSKFRAARVVFSEKAVLRKKEGKYHFMFQVFDPLSGTSSSQLAGAQIRCYAIRHAPEAAVAEEDCRPGDAATARIYFQSCAMNLTQPENGGKFYQVKWLFSRRRQAQDSHAIALFCACWPCSSVPRSTFSNIARSRLELAPTPQFCGAHGF